MAARLRSCAAELRRHADLDDHDADVAAARRRIADRYDTLADLAELAARERTVLQEVAGRMGTTVVYVPLFAHDVHDLTALHEVGTYLVG